MRHAGAIIGLAILGLVMTAGASAQTCTASATGIMFGTYQPLSGLPGNSTATVTVTCNPGLISILVSYTIQLGPGSSGRVTARSMSGAGGHLAYQLYSDPSYTQIWGNGTAGSSGITDGYLLGAVLAVTRNYTVYGRIPANSAAGVGSYTDTTTVLVSY